MKLKQFFRRAVEMGIAADPRNKNEITRLLKREADREKTMDRKQKNFFDAERSWNPYADSRIIAGSGEEDVKHLMVGIDIETPEVLLAHALREQGKKIDCLLVHHPEDRALLDLDHVMGMQIDLLALHGVPVNHSEGVLRSRQERIKRTIHHGNFLRAGMAAGLLGFPAVVCHTITDNLVWRLIEKEICSHHYNDLQEIIHALLDIPEYAYYAKKGNPPMIVNGSGRNRPGKVVATEFTGGTNGPEEFLESQARAGVGTIISMHVTDKTLEEAKKHHVNMIQCSHMASDSIGINLLLDGIKKEEKKLSVIECSGFVRCERR